MPLSLFGNKFSPKKTPPRRAHSLSNLHLDASQSREEFGPDVGPVKLKLGGSEIQFENGMWVAGKKKDENFEITNIFTISKMFMFLMNSFKIFTYSILMHLIIEKYF